MLPASQLCSSKKKSQIRCSQPLYKDQTKTDAVSVGAAMFDSAELIGPTPSWELD